SESSAKNQGESNASHGPPSRAFQARRRAVGSHLASDIDNDDWADTRASRCKSQAARVGRRRINRLAHEPPRMRSRYVKIPDNHAPYGVGRHTLSLSYQRRLPPPLATVTFEKRTRAVEQPIARYVAPEKRRGCGEATPPNDPLIVPDRSTVSANGMAFDVKGMDVKTLFSGCKLAVPKATKTLLGSTYRTRS